MKCLKSKILVSLIALILVFSIGTVVFAGDWNPDAEVNVQISINQKIEVELTSGGSIQAELDPGTVEKELETPTMLKVKTNAKKWHITALLTDTDGFLTETDGINSGKLEIASALSGSNKSNWYNITTGSAIQVTPTFSVWGANNEVAFFYRFGTSWKHDPDTTYNMIIVYTATPES